MTPLGLIRHTSSVIAAAGGAVAIGDLGVAAGEMADERVGTAELLDNDRIHRADLHHPPGCLITGKRSIRAGRRPPSSRYVDDRYLA
jgi:hypothetical protein